MTLDPNSDTSRPRARPTPEYGLALVIHHVVTALLVAAFLGLGIWFVLKDEPDRRPRDKGTERPAAETLSSGRMERTEHRVRHALEVYRLRFGQPADELESLRRQGLLVPRDLYYGPGARKFRLESGRDLTRNPSP